MRMIGVIDLLGGSAVHAKGGCRHEYHPIERVGTTMVEGSAPALARFYVEQLGVAELYVADLDAIAGGAEQDDAVRAVAALGESLWIDAGVATVAQAQRALTRGAAHVIVGLETLTSFVALGAIADAIGSARTAFSLDLRDGRAIARDESMRGQLVEALAHAAVDAGASTVIVLDLARVGSGRGPDLAVLKAVRAAVPGVTLLAGGGVRGVEDLQALAGVGCDGALVATALHDAGGPALARWVAGGRAVHGNVTR